MRKLVLAIPMVFAFAGTTYADVIDYFALYGGYTEDNKAKAGSAVSRKMDGGFNVGGAFGWNISPNISLGVDFTYTDSDYSKTPGFYLETASVMAAGYYNFDIGSKWRPFVGVGVGGIQVTAHRDSSPTSGSDFVFGYEGTAGFTYPIQQDFGVVIAYKYQGASDSTINGFSPFEYSSHNISAGLIFNLD